MKKLQHAGKTEMDIFGLSVARSRGVTHGGGVGGTGRTVSPQSLN